MKFEDLKLPVLMKSPGHIFWSQKHIEVAHEHAKEAARAVYDQMHAYYEAKLAEANKCPQELLEYVQHFFKVAQQGREAGERLRAQIGAEVAKEKPEWRLPDPPPGQRWHRTDWTQDMLPEGYRPLLLGEAEQPDDEYKADKFPWDTNPMSGGASRRDHHRRTRRPLP